VADLVHRAYRRVALEFTSPVDPVEFSRLAGVSELAADGTRITFKVEGDLDGVVKAAARHTVHDVEVTEPTLEEVFLTYYGRGGERGRGGDPGRGGDHGGSADQREDPR
jgi:ABC-2 type transport system ATP-binding protein